MSPLIYIVATTLVGLSFLFISAIVLYCHLLIHAANASNIFRFILSDRSNFHKSDKLPLVVLAFVKYIYIYMYVYTYIFMMKNLNTKTLWKARWLFGKTKWRPGKTGTQQIWIRQLKENALRVSVVGRENISPTILALTVKNWKWTRLQRVIAAENLTACEGYESIRHAGANNVILPLENVNRMMGLWIRNTPTVFKGPLLSDSVRETFLISQEFSGPRVIRQLLRQT